jgi:hypothetical protein
LWIRLPWFLLSLEPHLFATAIGLGNQLGWHRLRSPDS